MGIYQIMVIFLQNPTGKELIEELDREIKSRANIKVFTDAELIEKKRKCRQL